MASSLTSYSLPVLRRTCIGRCSFSSARPPPPLTSASAGGGSNSSSKNNNNNNDNNNSGNRKSNPDAAATHLEQPHHQQPFVHARISPGEWDPETRTNPLYRPKFRSRARILHEDDFAKQPTVGFSGEYENFQDAMVTLSWLDESDQKQIYQLYLELLLHSHQKHQRTSHEYIMRVIAQKFNITAERVAAVVQLQHNEEQMKRDPNAKLLTEAAEYMENAIKETIVNAYKTFKLKKPDEPFVTDPVGVSGLKESKTYQVVEDLLDVDQIMRDTVLREEKEARLAIDGHHYVEDVDDETVPIPLGKDCKKLLKTHEKFVSSQIETTTTTTTTTTTAVPLIPPQEEAKPASGERRERWKFVAQVVNTRDLKKKHSSHRSYINNSPEDTLVEHNGTLRAANLADVKQVAWKPIRHVSERTYADAKKGWLDRQLRGIEDAWGPAVAKPPPAARVVEQEKDTTDEKTKADDGGGGGGGEKSLDEEGDSKEQDNDTSDSSSSEESSDEEEKEENTEEENQDDKKD